MAVKEVLGIVNKGIEYLTLLLKTSTVRRMRKAIESGERYIQINECDGEYEKLKDKPELRLKYLAKYRRIFFKYNN